MLSEQKPFHKFDIPPNNINYSLHKYLIIGWGLTEKGVILTAYIRAIFQNEEIIQKLKLRQIRFSFRKY